MGAFQIDKCIFYNNLDLKLNGVLVHCGAGVSRVHNTDNIVSYISDSISDKVQKDDIPPIAKIPKIKTIMYLPKPRFLTAIKIILKKPLNSITNIYDVNSFKIEIKER